jgi:hypothetical protein
MVCLSVNLSFDEFCLVAAENLDSSEAHTYQPLDNLAQFRIIMFI